MGKIFKMVTPKYQSNKWGKTAILNLQANLFIFKEIQLPTPIQKKFVQKYLVFHIRKRDSEVK